ncbi:MAG TPA: DUF3786 domain-containing protein [Candidatus Blautia excrementipullorum]|nr:DUF3786 domain-containing protein [Candidatus Blautia excrementipullorum]
MKRKLIIIGAGLGGLSARQSFSLTQMMPYMNREMETMDKMGEKGNDGRRLGVHKENGKIIAMEDHDPVTCYERLNVYTLFGYVSSLAHYKDDWVRFDRLKGTSPFSKAFQEGVIGPFSRMFSGHVKELSRACEKLGGKKLPWSDAGYELKAFECIPVRFLFWDGDDEFPAQGNVLFDVSATDFIHGESVVTIAAIGLDRIAKLAGVPMDRSAFPIF